MIPVINKKQKSMDIVRWVRIAALSGAMVAYSAGAFAAVMSNTTLPNGGQWVAGGSSSLEGANGVLNIKQDSQNAVIKWNDFSIGSNAEVNFSSATGAGFNILNYVNGGNISQIYGTMNAEGGNVFLVNNAGTVIGKSAQINVGSLYVSNKKLDENKLSQFNGNNINSMLYNGQPPSAAQIMSLGNINATRVTFEGNRIVLDTERLKDTANSKLAADKIIVNTTNAADVVLGYDAYDSENKTYKDQNVGGELATVNGNTFTKADGYMWVDDYEQLNAIRTNLGGNYALHSSIDATSSSQNSFTPIQGDKGEAFTGKLDGLLWQDANIAYGIFDLSIDKKYTSNVGLFASTNGATINNLLISGGSIKGDMNVGGVAGLAKNTNMKNVVSSIDVEGNSSVGGIVGTTQEGGTYDGLRNAGSIKGTGSTVGGIIGHAAGTDDKKVTIKNSNNLGHIEGIEGFVGGIIGYAEYTDFDNVTNILSVNGKYNVGGIVGYGQNASIKNAVNNGNIMASGYIKENYEYSQDYYTDASDTTISQEVYVANVGGIAGNLKDSTIENALNETGNVHSTETSGNGDTWYIAGNVGGIVGRAEDTEIKKAVNTENTVYGAHNIGGIAGFIGGTSTIDSSYNNGGEVMGSGARNDNGFVKEEARRGSEPFIVGNIGGVAGYMYGDDVYLHNVGNRGHVHSRLFDTNKIVPESAKAANVGGVVGRVDRNQTLSMADLKGESSEAALEHVWNTGNVQGYTAVGGVAGMMYNGEIKNSYNQGRLTTTRQVKRKEMPLNMGGIVGDTTESTNAYVNIYDVYNSGQIGDEKYEYYARHVAGIAGRFSGNMEKAYNTGNIYNGYSTVGGLVGYFYRGSMKNSFNTGNITVVNNDKAQSMVGGIIGSAHIGRGDLDVTNVYNLGILRSFQNASGINALGGLVGNVVSYDKVEGEHKLNITNAYTIGNLATFVNGNSKDNKANMILGMVDNNTVNQSNVSYQNVHYIKPFDADFDERIFDRPYERDSEHGQAVTVINFADRNNQAAYKFSFSGFTDNNYGITGNTEDNWRIYDEFTLPMLNAFMPNAEEYLENNHENIKNVWYGTAYNPLLTIIEANDGVETLTFDWFGDLNPNYNDSFTVVGAGLTLNDFSNSSAHNGDDSGEMYYTGSIYADGELTLNGNDDRELLLGRGAKLYGSSVNINNGGDLTIYSDIAAHGKNGSSDIVISGKDVEVMGSVTTTKEGDSSRIYGMNGFGEYDETYQANIKKYISDSSKPVPDSGHLYTLDVTAGAGAEGNLTIKGTGDVNVLIGTNKTGKFDIVGNMNVAAGADAYVDADLKIGGNLEITGAEEALLDVSNIGKAGNKYKLVEFLQHFGKDGKITMNVAKDNKGNEIGDKLLAIDLWNGEKFDFKNYGGGLELQQAFAAAMEKAGLGHSVHIWVSDVEQLAAIDQKDNVYNFGQYNYALKNNIDATGADFTAIENFSGVFDGRDKNIVGLNAKANNDNNVGLFGIIGATGKVKDFTLVGGTFTGGTAGTVAGVNEGHIDNIATFGNRVTGTGGLGHVGGIAGVNKEGGTISNVNVNDSVAIEKNNFFAGGIVGRNNGALKDVVSNSAISINYPNRTEESFGALGGVVGVNQENGSIINADSQGVVNGLYKTPDGIQSTADNVGGVAGCVMGGKLEEIYNESSVTGNDHVGGIAGYVENGALTNIVNAGIIMTESKIGTNDTADYVGGLFGIVKGGTVTTGRNTGSITGENYVGGIAGQLGEDSTLQNIINDGNATINGQKYVGGIAGLNQGKINATDSGLVNKGEIWGNQFVGGIAGVNIGTITNTINDITLHVNGTNGQYFGGVVGINAVYTDEKTGTQYIGTIEDAKNRGNVVVEGASYVGGIAGANKGKLQGAGNSNTGNVTGKDYVGGVAGVNTGKLENGVTIKNDGEVTATDGGAGGIFGVNGEKNTGKSWTGVTLINNGKVTGVGDSGTGGIFGVNYDDFAQSSLINSATGVVSGGSNVGGLIGVNNGNITGGRDNGDNYYAHQIYNNGTVTGAGDNVGGLFGSNAGKVTAAYNTGVVTGETNVGGIAGVNSGTIDQAFNSVFDGGKITGTANVGAIVGNNGGTVTNVYTTTEIAGNNNTTASVGAGNGASNVKGDSNIWKEYGDGENEGTNMLLRVFLTKLKFEPNENFENIIYNAGAQDVTFEETTDSHGNIALNVFVGDIVVGTLSTASTDKKPAHSLQDYLNNNVLLQGNKNAQNAGEHSILVGTQQIGSTAENHNNLGYDFTDFKFKIQKATIDVILSAIERTYGSGVITSGNGKYEYSYGNVNEAMLKELEGVILGGISDGAVDDLESGKTTNDAGTYTWSREFTLSDELTKNYQFRDGKSSITATADSVVNKASLNISANDAAVVQGNKPNYGGNVGALVNGDSWDGLNISWGVSDSNIENIVGTHENKIGVFINGKFYDLSGSLGDMEQVGFFKNYEIAGTAGDLTVTAPEVPPVDPDEPGIENWQFWEAEDKYAWGKKREERERKAEIRFVDGGMKI